MIVTFIGHAKWHYDEATAKKIMEALVDRIEGEDVTFYLGINGNFDILAKKCCLLYKKKYKNAKLVFVTPYMDERYFKQHEFAIEGFDEIIYPDLEKVPKRYAIAARNKFMIDKADVLIAFASHVFGNAHLYLQYALSKYKDCVNLG